MYDQYYGLSGRPFQLTPDPAFYFESGTHRKAMSYLGYALAQGEGFIVITGDSGTGKTTLGGNLMATIDPRRLTAVQIVPTQAGGDDMLRLAAQALGIATDGFEKAQILTRIEALLHQNARAGKRALLIVDEAQNLSPPALQELRMLSNFQLGGQSLLQIFFLGQPGFRDVITSEAQLDQIRQRIIAIHHLDAMQADEVAPYIEQRLRVVGWTGRPRFTPDGYALLARESGGIPRRLNALVSRVLLLGAIDNLDIIDRRVIEAVIADAGADSQAGGRDSVEVPQHVSEQPTSASDAFDVPHEAPLDAQAETRGDLMDLQAIRSEVDAYSAALSNMEPTANADMAAQLRAFEQRLGVLEQRVHEQDEVLRRVLAKLIEWAERDDRNGPFADRAA